MSPDPLKRSRQRNGAVTYLPLVMKVASIVYNPPPKTELFQNALENGRI